MSRRRSSTDDEKMSKEEYRRIKQTFQYFDKNNDGRMSTNELGALMRSMGQNPSHADLRRYMRQLDQNESGKIEFTEFLNIMKGQMKNARQSQADLRQAFRLFDRDGSGYISASELRRMLCDLGEPMSKAEVDELMDDADTNRDGYLDIDEFCQLMNSM